MNAGLGYLAEASWKLTFSSEWSQIKPGIHKLKICITSKLSIQTSCSVNRINRRRGFSACCSWIIFNCINCWIVMNISELEKCVLFISSFPDPNTKLHRKWWYNYTKNKKHKSRVAIHPGLSCRKLKLQKVPSHLEFSKSSLEGQHCW